MKRWIKHRMPTAGSLSRNRMLRPLSPVLGHHNLWHFNRRTVAGGVAVGLFFGFLIPVAQILFAAVAAVWLRVNLPVAAASTLVTNPFTFPPIYFAAYGIGSAITGRWVPRGPKAIEDAAAEASTFVGGWLDNFIAVGQPLALGLLVLAVVGSVTGYFVVHAVWRGITLLQLRRKRQRNGLTRVKNGGG